MKNKQTIQMGNIVNIQKILTISICDPNTKIDEKRLASFPVELKTKKQIKQKIRQVIIRAIIDGNIFQNIKVSVPRPYSVHPLSWDLMDFLKYNKVASYDDFIKKCQELVDRALTEKMV